MPKWIPEKKWKGQEAFIIGGGDSLKTFDWNLLKPLLTIGCNNAFIHGHEICKLCVFGDKKWFDKHKRELEQYKGIVLTNVSQLLNANISWLWTMDRKSRGLHEDALGWNYNTGAVALNLALLLGATKIYLLGFDMQLGKKGNSNWHDNTLDKPDADVYNKFLTGFERCAKDLNKFPGVEVFNIADNSNLIMFPKIGVKEFWDDRKNDIESSINYDVA